MILLIKLLIAHFIGDFLLQTKNTIDSKQQKKLKSIQLYFHVAIHGILAFIMTLSTEYWKGILFLVVSHFIIDAWKLYQQNDKNKRVVFVIDQLMHLLVIVTITDYYSPWIATAVLEIDLNQILLFVLAILLTTTVTSRFIKVIISKWQPENEDGLDDSLSSAGSYIGILERLFVFGFILSGSLQGIGFLLAAKSVFRFGDLKDSKDRKLTEYILIGTLLSFGFAIIIGYLYLKMKSKL